MNIQSESRCDIIAAIIYLAHLSWVVWGYGWDINSELSGVKRSIEAPGTLFVNVSRVSIQKSKVM